MVVCNEGDTTDDAIQPNSSCSSIYCLCIRDGDLWVADTITASLGLRFIWPGETLPVFIRLPKNESLGVMNDGRSICSAMRSCTSTQQQLLARGTQNHVFTENGNKYCCVGAQPGRAKRGVLSGLYRLKNGFPQATNGILYISFSSARSMLLTGSWTQTSFDISHVQG